ADLSALTFPSPYRINLIKEIKDNIPPERLVLGSDYPIPITSLWIGAGGEIDKEEWEHISKISNPLDRNVETIRALGFDEQVLHNAGIVLRLEPVPGNK
ncbi:hypothetical protein JW926_10610, partial [Candidatus Sumerlaeota bacterium]|nr:hypothetical protein [Candidatus Sumerlaeota bacterium]